MKILVPLGTRPEIVKLAPVIRALRRLARDGWAHATQGGNTRDAWSERHREYRSGYPLQPAGSCEVSGFYSSRSSDAGIGDRLALGRGVVDRGQGQHGCTFEEVIRIREQGAGPLDRGNQLRRADPPYEGEVKYGDRAEHCWNGDPSLPNYLSRLHYHTMYVPKMLERMEKTAPPGADLRSWRY